MHAKEDASTTVPWLSRVKIFRFVCSRLSRRALFSIFKFSKVYIFHSFNFLSSPVAYKARRVRFKFILTTRFVLSAANYTELGRYRTSVSCAKRLELRTSKRSRMFVGNLPSFSEYSQKLAGFDSPEDRWSRNECTRGRRGIPARSERPFRSMNSVPTIESFPTTCK